jgi:DNA-binding HxlR family transcriptional regulator
VAEHASRRTPGTSRGIAKRRAAKLVTVASAERAGEAGEFDAVLHHRMRLGIVSALAGADSLTFVELRELLGTTDGNLSVHARKLEDAGLIACAKSFAERRPRSDYTLTPVGQKALRRYLAHMEALIASTRNALNR